MLRGKAAEFAGKTEHFLRFFCFTLAPAWCSLQLLSGRAFTSVLLRLGLLGSGLILILIFACPRVFQAVLEELLKRLIQAPVQVRVQCGALWGSGEACFVSPFAFVMQDPFCSSDAKVP